MDKFQEALIKASKAIELNPKNALAHSLRGHSNLHLGNREEALQDYNQAFTLDPTWKTNYIIHEMILSTLSDQNDYLLTLAAIDNVLETDPNNSFVKSMRDELQQKQSEFHSQQISEPEPESETKNLKEDKQEELDAEELKLMENVASFENNLKQLVEESISLQKDKEKFFKEITIFENEQKEINLLRQQIEATDKQLNQEVQSRDQGLPACKAEIQNAIAQFKKNYPALEKDAYYKHRKCHSSKIPKSEALLKQQIDNFNNITIPSIKAKYGFSPNWTPPSYGTFKELINKINPLITKHNDAREKLREKQKQLVERENKLQVQYQEFQNQQIQFIALDLIKRNYEDLQLDKVKNEQQFEEQTEKTKLVEIPSNNPSVSNTGIFSSGLSNRETNWSQQNTEQTINKYNQIRHQNLEQAHANSMTNFQKQQQTFRDSQDLAMKQMDQRSKQNFQYVLDSNKNNFESLKHQARQEMSRSGSNTSVGGLFGSRTSQSHSGNKSCATSWADVDRGIPICVSISNNSSGCEINKAMGKLK